MDITSFKGNFIHGARPNLYEIIVDGVQEKMRFLARSSQLPGATVGEIEVPYMGRVIKVAGDRVFENWDVTVFNDTDFGIRRSIEEWMSGINAHNGNVGHTTMGQYYRDATVRQLNRDGSLLYTYQFVGIWPTTMGPIEIAYDNNNAVEEFTVTFSVGMFWKSDTIQN